MSRIRWVVLGVAGPRAAWFHELSRNAHGAAVPVDFIKCISVTEVRARLSSGRRFSALVIGDDTVGLDRDLIAECVAQAVAVIVVATGVAPRDWLSLGAAACLDHEFDRDTILSALETHSGPVNDLVARPTSTVESSPDRHRGALIAVTGIGGAGASTLAMGIAQRFASEPSHTSMVLLADLALDADQAMLHHAREITPSLQELVEACGRSAVGPDELRRHVFDVSGRGYHLLLGLRRHRDWTALRPQAFRTAVRGLCRNYRIVIADTDNDVEGQTDTGSVDIEDRNLMARHVHDVADLVVVVGHPGTKGIYALHRTLQGLAAAGREPSTMIPVINRAPKRPRRRAEESAALAALWRGQHQDTGEAPGNPVFESVERGLEAALRDGTASPGIGARLHGELLRRLEVASPHPRAESVRDDEPVAVTPGSLGSWSGDAA